MQVNPYLMFTGQCEEAFTFYAKCLGGKIEAMMPHEGTPAEAHTPPEWRKKILHARMSLGDGGVLMASDSPPGRQSKPQGFCVSIQVNQPSEAERIYHALAENGTVHMPIGETFFAIRFGMLVDRFGIPWMVNCPRRRKTILLLMRGDAMKVMVLVKASKDSEAGVLPSPQMLAAMGKFNEELVKAGVLVAAEGLQPSAKGKRVHFSGDRRTVMDGPFAETKELLAGFWIWEVKSLDEALDWMKRCPNPHNEDGAVEIRPLFSAEDFAPCDPTGEHRAAEARLRQQAAKR